jgi:hypothetical protein
MKKLINHLSIILIAFNFLTACSGMPVGPNELVHISQQQTVTGVYAVKAGLQPLAQVLENPTGSQILFWPGAKNGSQVLWNMACLLRCQGDWQGEVTRYIAASGKAMTAERAGQLTRGLVESGWWRAVPLTGATLAQASAVLAANVAANWYTILITPVITLPEQPEFPQS